MPSFREQVEMLGMWRRFPGREHVERGVALTFDDGPDPEGTPAVLDALDAAGAKATFFLVGEQLLAHHELGGEVARRGHALGLHCFRHQTMERLTRAEALGELRRGLDAIEAATGSRPSRFRPPYGRIGDHAHAAALELGLELVWWSGWGMDWEPLPPERLADLVTRDLTSGAIVVLHDSARYAPRTHPGATAEALSAVLAAAERRGLTPVTL